MSRTETTVWHVTPESNVNDVQENGLQPRGVGIETYIGEPPNVERVTEGVYVTRRRRTMERYAETCLDDVHYEMDDGERFALFKATVEKDRLTSDPESDLDPDGPNAYIHVGSIEDVELVTIGLED